MRIYHHSQDSQCRFPLGAVTVNTPVTLRLYTDLENAKVALITHLDGQKTERAMQCKGLGQYEITVAAPQTPAVWWYAFSVALPDGQTLYYGNREDMLGGEGMVQAQPARSFQITVYRADFTVPKFMREGIMYQIFPDRFFRTHKPVSSRGDVTLHENWDEKPLVLTDERSGDNFATDFFGGTLKGIEQKLPYLKDLGVTVLYLNPIFKARSNHRYDTGDYRTVDPLLGENDDLDSLCAAAKEQGMRVILDGVFSHTGEDSLYFNRYGRYDSVGAYQSERSPYASWYTFRSFPDDYACWWNFPTLPEVNKADPSYREFMFGEDGVCRHWIGRGTSGWRLDVVDELPVHFLQGLRAAVKRQDPDAVLIGEVWEDASRKVAYGQMRSYCLGDTTDSVMNYPLREVLLNFFTHRCAAGDVVRLIKSQQENYALPFYYALMNLPGSHDRARVLNVLCGKEGDDVPQRQRGGIVLTEREKEIAKKRFLCIMAILCALPGIPCLYYGDEVGMEGAADPFCRGPFPWDHRDETLHAAIRRLFHERRKRPVLQSGYLDVAAQGDDTLVITRTLKDGKDVFMQEQNDKPFTLVVTRDHFMLGAR